MRQDLRDILTSAILAASLSTTGYSAMAETPSQFIVGYGLQTIETPTHLIELTPLDDDVRFSISLRDKRTGFAQHHAFDGQAASDPTPFQIDQTSLCNTQVLLVTIQYPWRHALPQYRRVLETYAFRLPDFAFIDMTFGPLTDISMQDSDAADEQDLVADMLAPVSVNCLTDAGRQPFRFLAQRD